MHNVAFHHHRPTNKADFLNSNTLQTGAERNRTTQSNDFEVFSLFNSMFIKTGFCLVYDNFCIFLLHLNILASGTGLCGPLKGTKSMKYSGLQWCILLRGNSEK